MTHRTFAKYVQKRIQPGHITVPFFELFLAHTARGLCMSHVTAIYVLGFIIFVV